MSGGQVATSTQTLQRLSFRICRIVLSLFSNVLRLVRMLLDFSGRLLSVLLLVLPSIALKRFQFHQNQGVTGRCNRYGMCFHRGLPLERKPAPYS